MATFSQAGVTDFEVYVLMTMRRRFLMAGSEGLIESKLAEVGLSLADGQRAYEQIAATLADEACRFREMKRLLGVIDSESTHLNYGSALWPGFDFVASADGRGLLESAQYEHVGRELPGAKSPRELPPWSVDIAGFGKLFGPLEIRGKWPLFDEILPAYEEHEFRWDGDRYGVRFVWGMLLSSSMYWD